MKIEGSCVTFEPCDAAFVKKFGPLEAANMVLDYHHQMKHIELHVVLNSMFGSTYITI